MIFSIYRYRHTFQYQKEKKGKRKKNEKKRFSRFFQHFKVDIYLGLREEWVEIFPPRSAHHIQVNKLGLQGNGFMIMLFLIR